MVNTSLPPVNSIHKLCSYIICLFHIFVSITTAPPNSRSESRRKLLLLPSPSRSPWDWCLHPHPAAQVVHSFPRPITVTLPPGSRCKKIKTPLIQLGFSSVCTLLSATPVCQHLLSSRRWEGALCQLVAAVHSEQRFVPRDSDIRR